MRKYKLLDEKVMMINLQAQDASDALNQMSGALTAAGYVKESYAAAIIKREEEYSTGLPAEGMGIAIPHASTEHVNEAIIAVGVLEKPVAFRMMGNHDEIIQVEILFMLALKEAHSQLQMLQSLMGLIQDDKFLAKIKNVSSETELVELIGQRIS